MSKRKFFKTILKVEILSEDSPLEWDDLDSVAYAISQGDCSGKVEEIKTVQLTGKEAAKALKEQGSDPEFFQIDENGNEKGENNV